MSVSNISNMFYKSYKALVYSCVVKVNIWKLLKWSNFLLRLYNKALLANFYCFESLKVIKDKSTISNCNNCKPEIINWKIVISNTYTESNYNHQSPLHYTEKCSFSKITISLLFIINRTVSCLIDSVLI